ncbi:50S ribosomal protein L1 [Xylariomycetidae sp. FL0641]|nr:50S ribosomal protein L1 [Xylariomycetidae sp. FL0641]
MASVNQCVASLARLSLASATRPALTPVPRYLAPSVVPSIAQQTRWKSAGTVAMQARERAKLKAKRKKRASRYKEYKYAVPSGPNEQFSLCDAMRYLRAAEVGRPPRSVTYEVSLKLRTPKNSPVIRGRLRLPYPVKNNTRIAVICKDGSSAMQDARAGGAVAFGEESLFELIRANAAKLPFNRLICHVDSEPELKKANLGRILGPKGLMPSLKTNTITRSVKTMMHEMVGAEVYREKIGAIRMPIGNILFTPKQLSENVKMMVSQVKEGIVKIEDKVNKDLIEVVLSSTNGPGFTLNGSFNPTDERVKPADLTTAM